MQIENEFKELRILKAEHTNTKYDMEARLKTAPERENRLVNYIQDMKKDFEAVRNLPVSEETKLPVFQITIGDKTYDDKAEAGKALEEATLGKLMMNMNTDVKIGSFQGFELSVYMDSLSKIIRASIKGESSYTVEFGSSYTNNLRKIENRLYSIDSTIAKAEGDLAQHRDNTAEAKKIAETPFQYESELKIKSDRLETLTYELNEAAIAAKRNHPEVTRTAYFDRAKLKKEAVRARQQERKVPDKGKDNPEK